MSRIKSQCMLQLKQLMMRVEWSICPVAALVWSANDIPAVSETTYIRGRVVVGIAGANDAFVALGSFCVHVGEATGGKT